jgi:hypothetical protein
MDAEELLRRAKDPRAWASRSRCLRISAGVLKRECEKNYKSLMRRANLAPEVKEDLWAFVANRDAMKMLLGLALENALKGKILKDKPDQVIIRLDVNGRGDFVDADVIQLGVDLSKKGHDLIQLAQLAGIKMTTELRRTLIALTESVLWEARYPVPRTTKKPDSAKLQQDWDALDDPWSVVTPLLDGILDDLEKSPPSDRQASLARGSVPAG